IVETSAVEEMSRALISEAAAIAFDSALFGVQAAGASPAGLLYNVPALTPASGSGMAPLPGGIQNLVDALASAHAGRGVIFIESPTQTASLKLQAGPRFDYDVLASQALADATIVALEPSSLVSAWGGAPDFETSTMTLLHQESATPGDIVSSGSG